MIDRLHAIRLSVQRGRRPVVTDMDWRFERGRIQWVVGDNGHGKSSLLRVLAGRARPAKGKLVAEAPDGRVRLRPTTVYYAPAMRIPPDVRVGDWARLVGALTPGSAVEGPGIAPSGPGPGRRLGRASTGEAKRALLDALLAVPAEVTILDEPFEHLAEAARRRLAGYLERRAEWSVVVVATHHGVPVPTGSGSLLSLEGPGGGQGATRAR